MATKEDFRSLTGSEKAATLMLSLSEEHAASLFALMDEEEIKALSQSMANLGSVTAYVVERLFMDFADNMSTTGSLVGSMESTERFLMKILGKERVVGIMEEVRGPAGRTVWDKLSNVSEDLLANYLKNEYPQTVAVVLSKIRPKHASRVLTLLPQSFAVEVVLRMTKMESIQKEILEDVERTLRTEFMNNLTRTSKRDSYGLVAEIFNFLDRDSDTRFLNALEEKSKESAEKIRNLMFTFEDLARLNDTSMQTLIRAYDKGKLALALKGMPEGLKEAFFSRMAERAANLLKEDITALGMVRLREVEEAQSGLVALAKELERQGIISISGRNDGSDEMVG